MNQRIYTLANRAAQLMREQKLRAPVATTLALRRAEIDWTEWREVHHQVLAELSQRGHAVQRSMAKAKQRQRRAKKRLSQPRLAL